MGVKVGRIHLLPRGVTKWWCGLLSEFFEHLLLLLFWAMCVLVMKILWHFVQHTRLEQFDSHISYDPVSHLQWIVDSVVLNAVWFQRWPQSRWPKDEECAVSIKHTSFLSNTDTDKRNVYYESEVSESIYTQRIKSKTSLVRFLQVFCSALSQHCWLLTQWTEMGRLVSWSLMYLFSTNMAISETRTEMVNWLMQAVRWWLGPAGHSPGLGQCFEVLVGCMAQW